jgi:DNA-binding GntR family transcriptional regulator
MNVMHRPTLAEQAYEELQAQIISGRLPAGQRLLPEELAGQLAISQTPIKEALVQLERDGLVVGTARRASMVRRFSIEDIIEIYDARILIEVNAVRIGVPARRATGGFIARLQATFELQMRNAERQTGEGLAEAIRLDREFHATLVSLGGNRLLAGWHRVLLQQTQTLKSYSLRNYRVAETRAEHAAIIDALKEGRGSAVVRALRGHLLASRDEMLARPPEDLPHTG